MASTGPERGGRTGAARRPRYLSLEGKITFILLGAVIATASVTALMARLLPGWLAVPMALAVMVPLTVLALRRFLAPVGEVFQALVDGVSSLRDKDFSISIARDRRDELGELVALYNDVGAVLREERQDLYQRELLLDTVIQSTPLALVLTSQGGFIVYANMAARRLFGEGRKLEGFRFRDVLARAGADLREALTGGEDGLFTVEADDEPETVHISQREFLLNAQPHRLYLITHMTRAISRQEVATWKKVIRVMSHELNNSLGPIGSLAHTGRQMVDAPDPAKLTRIFTTIEERVGHLRRFLEGYARVAKLPAPRPEPVAWSAFVEGLAAAEPFTLAGALPATAGYFDPGQMEQVLINLLRNAREAGSPPPELRIDALGAPPGVRITVADRGSGMSEAVLKSALLPFYSTRKTGTGLGLALCREIVEAHGGKLRLQNRRGGGLEVDILLS